MNKDIEIWRSRGRRNKCRSSLWKILQLARSGSKRRVSEKKKQEEVNVEAERKRRRRKKDKRQGIEKGRTKGRKKRKNKRNSGKERRQ
jgi:hypothetical protein